MEIAILVFLGALALVALSQLAVIVPEQKLYLLERFGKFDRTLGPGIHFLIPIFERVAYRHSLKDLPIDIDEQICITKDNVQVGVDGILYIRIIDAKRASYAVEGYEFALTQMAQTLIRSEIGQIDLDQTFVERVAINNRVLSELGKASEDWGIRVLRYELQNINPPVVIVEAMEKQMRAEREKRAVVLASEASRDAEINEAKGRAIATCAIAKATADGLRDVGLALSETGGEAAMQLRIAEAYIKQFGELGKACNTLVVPANLSDIASMISLATRLVHPPETSEQPVLGEEA